MRRISLLAVLTMCLFTSCALLRDLLATAFVSPTFTFKRVDLANLSLDSITLNTVWSLENPNNVGVKIAQVDYALFIEGKQVVAGAPPLGLEMAPHGATELVFPANVKFTDVVAVVATFLNKDTATYRAEGRIGFDTPVGIVSFPMSKDGNFDVPKMPAFALSNPRLTNVNLTGATVEFPVQVTNRNGFPLKLGQLKGRLFVGSQSVGQVSADLGELTGKGTRTVNLPLNINFLSAGSAMASAAAGQPAQVRLDAQLNTGGVQLPVNVDQVLKFTR